MGKGIEKSCAKTAWGLGRDSGGACKGVFAWGWGTPDRWGNMCPGHPTYHVNVIKLKWEIIWTGGLPHLSRLPDLPGVPHFHVNRPKDYYFQYLFPVYPMIDKLRQFTSTVMSIFWLLFHCSVAFFARLHWPRAWQAIFDSIYYTAIPIIAYMIEIPAGFVQGSMYIIISIYKVLGVELICLAGNRGLPYQRPAS